MGWEGDPGTEGIPQGFLGWEEGSAFPGWEGQAEPASPG